jgi:hypothetical protein
MDVFPNAGVRAEEGELRMSWTELEDRFWAEQCFQDPMAGAPAARDQAQPPVSEARGLHAATSKDLGQEDT